MNHFFFTLRTTHASWIALFIIFLGLGSSSLIGQPAHPLVQLIVTPVSPDWTYELGERADFEVRVLRNGQLLKGGEIRYQIGPEQMPAQLKGEETLEKGEILLKGIAYQEPGFVSCEVELTWEGHSYKARGTAGFTPELIQPVTKMPEDFDAFWTKAKEELAAVPLESVLTLQPELCTPTTNVYHVQISNFTMNNWQNRTGYVYGMLSVPKAAGKYPALLVVPGAGVRPYSPERRGGDSVITLSIGIHGLPVNLAPDIYQDLAVGALQGYNVKGMQDRDTYYYKRVYLGCVRAIDFLYSLPEFDGQTLGVSGGSQGGALAIVTTGLDSRVKFLMVRYPALCDLTGYLEGRAGGWPHMFRDYDEKTNPGWLLTAPYYDVVNFARRVEVPGWYTWGFNDNVCPPTSMFAAYNVIPAPKELHLYLETAHWTFPEQLEAGFARILGELTNQ